MSNVNAQKKSLYLAERMLGSARVLIEIAVPICRTHGIAVTPRFTALRQQVLGSPGPQSSW